MCNLIGNDGSLRVSSDKVTWFQFLRLSRETNSKAHGWNSRTYWSKYGLDRLIVRGTPAEFLAGWTERSLENNAEPTPRERDFQFEERRAARLSGTRGKAGSPADGKENAINWKLYRNIWERGFNVSYEVPLANESKGQMKVDLMVFHGRGRLEIIELKRDGADGPDSPLMALTEAICYALQAIRCWTRLSKDAKATFEKDRGQFDAGAEVTEINLILAAPGYWTHCNPEGGAMPAITEDQVKGLYKIAEVVNGTLKKQSPPVTLSLCRAEPTDDERGLVPISAYTCEVCPPQWSTLRKP